MERELRHLMRAILKRSNIKSNLRGFYMSPKFYGFLWATYCLAAAVVLLAGLMTMFTTVVFGFVAFGFVFMGMMCVLPGAVSHPHDVKQRSSAKPLAEVSAKASSAVTSYRSA
ncbi:MAG: hypothetical protein IPG67_10915 [Acidobacteria bacterium]|nr:hypothetical protein [Acidobacteriota bacterium]